MKRKFALALLTGFLALSSLSSKAFAIEEPNWHPAADTQQQVQEFSDQSAYFDKVLITVVPTDQQDVLNFDTVVDFKAAVNQMEQDTYSEQAAQADEPAVMDSETSTTTTKTQYVSGPEYTTTTYNGLRTIKWIPYSWNPFKMQILPTDMYIDFSFSYSGSGSSRKFTSMKSIVSSSSGFPTSWHQTNKTYNWYDYNHGVTIYITGYHLLGVTIAGQPIGAQFHDSYTKKYHF